MKNLLLENLDNVINLCFNNSNESIFLIDEEGQINFVNNTAIEELGYTFNELTNLKVWNLDIEVNTEEKFLNILKVNRNKDSSITQTFLKRKNGETFPVEVICKTVYFKNKRLILSYCRDISNRIERTRKIELYFDLIASSKDLIFLINHKTMLIEFANKTTCDILGYSFEELIGKDINSIRIPLLDKNSLPTKEVFKKIDNVKKFNSLGKYITKDNTEICVESSLVLKEYNGEKFVVSISRDISERIQIEIEKEELNKKLKKYNTTLYNEVNKVKNELEEYGKIMIKQSKMAAMGEMLENIAHQWRQPLSAVSVLSTGMILQNQEKNLKKKELSKGLNTINNYVQYLSKTIDDFRDFFKPTKEKNTFELSSLIDSSLTLAKATFAKDEINFIINIEKMDITTYENELMQVILNLLSNAKDELIKKDYKRLIFIEAQSIKDKLVLTVKDNAGGIDSYILDRIFEPYFTTKHNYQGTGIGLYMSKKIISHMSGEIYVKNCEFEYNTNSYTGACFVIEIPIF